MSETKLNLDDPRPPYLQIAEHFRVAIKEETLAAGEKLGSVRALADQFDVSPGTIQQALRILREEGLIVSWQGRGVFVRNPAYDTGVQKAPDTATIMKQLDLILDRVEQLESEMSQLEKKVGTLTRARKRS